VVRLLYLANLLADARNFPTLWIWCVFVQTASTSCQKLYKNNTTWNFVIWGAPK